MPRKPRQFEYDKPIEVTARYTRSVYVPAKELWKIKIVIRQMTSKYNVKLLNSYYNEKQFRLLLYFEKGCGCTLSKVMQWFLTRLAKCVNGVMKSHGKVFYDRFVSRILDFFHNAEKMIKTIGEKISYAVNTKYSLQSDPWNYSKPAPPTSPHIDH